MQQRGSPPAGSLLAMATPPPPPLRRALGPNERFLYTAEARYGGSFRIAGVATLAAAAAAAGSPRRRVTAAALTAAVAAVAARFDALRTTVGTADGDAVFLAADDAAAPRVDVRVGASAAADALTADAFAAAAEVLAAGTDGPWPARAPVAAADGAAAAAAPLLPWQVLAFLPPSTAAPEPEGEPGVAAAAAVVVWLLPHYLADGTSVDLLCAALVDALNADVSAAAASAAATAGVTPLPPPLTALFPPRGGRLGAAIATGRFLVEASLDGLTRKLRRGVVPATMAAATATAAVKETATVAAAGAPPAGGGGEAPPPASPASAAAARRTGMAVAVVGAPALARFRSAAKAAGVTVGAALVAALALALADAGVLAPARWWRPSMVVSVPMNARRAADALPDAAVGDYIGIVDVTLHVPPPPPPPLPQAAAADGGAGTAGGAAAGGRSRLWAVAGAAAAALRAPRARVDGAIHMGVVSGVVVGPHGPPFLDALVADPAAAGRLLPDPFVSNVGRCAATEAANGRAGAAGVAVTRVGLWDWEAQLGAPLGLYVATVGGVATLVMAWTEPLVAADTGREVLAAVVATVEAGLP